MCRRACVIGISQLDWLELEAQTESGHIARLEARLRADYERYQLRVHQQFEIQKAELQSAFCQKERALEEQMQNIIADRFSLQEEQAWLIQERGKLAMDRQKVDTRMLEIKKLLRVTRSNPASSSSSSSSSSDREPKCYLCGLKMGKQWVAQPDPTYPFICHLCKKDLVKMVRKTLASAKSQGHQIVLDGEAALALTLSAMNQIVSRNATEAVDADEDAGVGGVGRRGRKSGEKAAS